MSNKMIRGGQLLARSLKQKNIEHVFTLSGGFCNPALEGFMECQIPVINCPHEQIAGHLADGHTRITRKPTVCLVGPEGFSNAVPAMMEAWGERSPVIFVTGSSTLKRQGAGGFKEIDDVAIAAPLTKYSISVTDGNRIPEFVQRAWNMALEGYPGPVHLSIPVDIMFSSFSDSGSKDERPFSQNPRVIPKAFPDPKQFNVISEKLKKSKKPVLIGGHGIWWAKAEKNLSDLAERLSIPIFNVPYHQKLLPETNKCYMGLADFHQYSPSKYAIHNSDCIIMVGGKLDNQMNFGNPPFFPEKTDLICVNGSHEELQFNMAADQILLSDPNAFFGGLLNIAEDIKSTDKKTWLEDNQNKRSEWVIEHLRNLELTTGSKKWPKDAIHPLQLSINVQEAMSDGDHLVFDGGNTHFWSEIAVNLVGKKNHLSLGSVMHPGSYSLLGVGVSFALSAKRLNPKENVVLITGDGAFLSGGLSIEAAFQENLPIVVIVDNNGGLDCISQQQERLFSSGTHFATDFRDIPFHDLVKGLGGYGELVTKSSEIIPSVKRAIKSGKPACINVKTKGVISPIVEATSDKRDKASIE